MVFVLYSGIIQFLEEPALKLQTGDERGGEGEVSPSLFQKPKKGALISEKMPWMLG